MNEPSGFVRFITWYYSAYYRTITLKECYTHDEIQPINKVRTDIILFDSDQCPWWSSVYDAVPDSKRLGLRHGLFSDL